MQNCIANAVEYTHNNKASSVFWLKAYKELYGDGNSSGYNAKLVQGSQDDMPKGTQQVSCCFNNKKFLLLI